MLTSAVSRERPFAPAFVAEIDLAAPTEDLERLHAYASVRALLRINGTPVGVITQPVIDGRCAGKSLRRAAINELRWPILRHVIIAGLAAGFPDEGFDPAAFRPLLARWPEPVESPSVAVVVCTRERIVGLRRCLDAIARLDPAPDEVLVVDNASRTTGTHELVGAYSNVRYVREDRPGLDWARSRGVLETHSDVVAFTDDDVVVDPAWTGALKRAFSDAAVGAITGLVLPLELETPAQSLFERYGGFGRGFLRRSYRVDVAAGERATRHGGAGKFGTGANMAFRRGVLEDVGLFDPALDVGTVTNGGGDLDMFYRVVRAGHLLLYEPAAIVWHRHRREDVELREQLTNHGIGFYAYLTRNAIRFPGDAWGLLGLGLGWFLRWDVKRLLQAWFKPGMFPRELVLAEIRGSLRGPFRVARARQRAREIGASGAGPAIALEAPHRPAAAAVVTRERLARRVVDVTRPVGPLADIGPYAAVALDVTRGLVPVGTVTVRNGGRPLSAMEVRQAIVEEFGIDVLGGLDRPQETRYDEAEARLRDLFPGSSRAAVRPLDPALDASVVVATLDRPDDLRRALASLSRQDTARRIEIVVVDNHPHSGLTRPIVDEFAGVRLVEERRRGLSYARNAGIAASSGAIVIATDDDAIVPPNWVETLLAPFGDPEVMVVTGDVTPDAVDSKAERLFEAYGGLGRGPERMRVDGTWFRDFRRAVPTWRLGGTANAAFRACIFTDPAIGLLDESLGAGTPAGCSEDTDLFYRVLRAGYRIVYEPSAVVRHRHRTTMRALRRQIFAYAKGHVAYQLTTLLRDGDLRALVRIFFELPALYWWRIRMRLAGRSDYPISLVLLEVAGNLAGPFAWWRSRRRVRRLGRSAPVCRAACSTPPDGGPERRVLQTTSPPCSTS